VLVQDVIITKSGVKINSLFIMKIIYNVCVLNLRNKFRRNNGSIR